MLLLQSVFFPSIKNNLKLKNIYNNLCTIRQLQHSFTFPANDATFQARTQALPDANAEELSGKYQGDIVLDDFIIESMLMDFAQGRNAYTWPNTKWPNDTVVWEFGEGEFGKRKRLEKHFLGTQPIHPNMSLSSWTVDVYVNFTVTA